MSGHLPFTLLSIAALGIAQSVGTTFLDHRQLLSGVEDLAWFEANVPILDVPNPQIQDVYYYRWQSYKEHLLYTGPQYGYLSTEFLLPVGYGGPYGGIVAAAGHHINEGRWMTDQKPGKDLVNFWLAGPGTFPKLANDGLNPDTHDWAHEYSFWAGSVVWKQYLATGDRDFAVGHLDNLIDYYKKYDNHFDAGLGLYWQAPVWDATEYTAASYASSDPYHGGIGYRPTINSYQYGDARAIAQIATLKGDSATAKEYNSKADALRDATQKTLWDTGDRFFKHRARDNNPTGSLLKDREIMGYIPWMFNLPDGDTYSEAFSQLKDPHGFDSPFGPTTLENRSSIFYKDADAGCCHWDGPSWPFATAQTLTAVENLLNDYPAQSHFSASDYFTLLMRYVMTQFKDGKPYIAEAHDAYRDSWIYDSPNHSEDYNHSTFIDNIISGLLGLRAQPGNSLVINPLVPSSWTHFGLENVAYHGHLLTILWDQDGSHYKQGPGLRVYVDGRLVTSQPALSKTTVSIPAPIKQGISPLVNIAANPLSTPQGSLPIQSHTSSFDNPNHPLDGTIFRVGIPENTRWTTFGTKNKEDHFGVDLRRPQSISNVDLFFYDDNGGVRVPSSYDVQYLVPSTNAQQTHPSISANGTTPGNWVSVPAQTRSPSVPQPNSPVHITFPNITTSSIRIVAPNPDPSKGTGWGLSELQIWTSPIFSILNVNSKKTMGTPSSSSSAGRSSPIEQATPDYTSHSQLWYFQASPGGYFQIRNVQSGLSLTVPGGSKNNSTGLTAERDTGGEGQRWRVEDKGDGKMTGKATGRFVIRNRGSGLVAGVQGESTEDGASVVQFADTGTDDHLWELLATVPAGF